MKAFFVFLSSLTVLVPTSRLFASFSIEISTGNANSPVRISLPLSGRTAERGPEAPDLASAYWVVTPLPIVVPPRFGYYGAARNLNENRDVLGSDLSSIRHLAADGATADFGFYRFHFNAGRQLDDSGRIALNATVGNAGYLFRVQNGLVVSEQRYDDVWLTALDNAGGLLGVTLNLSRPTDRDYWGWSFIERGASRRDLAKPADSNFGADYMALNERNEVVGGALQLPTNWWRGLYLKAGGAPRWLPGYGSYEEVYNLNVHGQLVGSTTVPAGFGYAPGMYPALWDGGGVGRVKVLDTDRSLFGGEYGWAWSANRWGQIVGRTRSGGALWLNGKPHNLAGRIINPDNIRLDYFADINDRGEIVGAEYGMTTSPGSRAFIMRPVWISLGVDLNRDGKIALLSDGDKSDVTSTDMPFRFWINDDDDGIALNNESEVEGSTNIDYASRGDFGISSKRDLEDFARLWIDCAGITEALKSGDLQIGLEWKADTVAGSPAINLYPHFEPDGGTGYLTDDVIAIEQTTPPYSTTLVDVEKKNVVSSTNGIFIFRKEVFSNLSSNQTKTFLLFEGAGIGKGQLQLLYLNKIGSKIAEGGGVWMDLRRINTMFERVKATTNYGLSADGIDATMPLPHDHIDPVQVPQPIMGWANDDRGEAFVADPGEDLVNKSYIVFVHGWRQAPGIPPSGVTSSLTYARTMFKRLWHAGYKGRFVAFRWPTFYSGPELDDQSILNGILTYNDSEFRAWKAGQSLAQYVNQLPSGYRRNIAAHSMGNVVTGSAFKYGMAVDSYALLNAAVPAIAYQETARRQWPTFAGIYSGVILHRDYNVPSPIPHAPDSGTPVDDAFASVRDLSYVNQLGAMNATNVINFYLESDFATSISWNANNMVSRPDAFALPADGSSGYKYISTLSDPDWRLRLKSFFGSERRVTDAHEVMSYACKVPTFTSGADGNTRGSILRTVDMGAYGFDREHSAQWQRRFQQTTQFYHDLLVEFGLTPIL